MAERSRFFNSTENDIREYTASEFAEYFSKFLSNGVYVEDGEAGLKVSPGSGLSVNIAPGYAYLEGYLYENDTELTKEIEPADNVLNRIDRVVIRLDVTNRQILTHIKKGTFSSSPTPPALVNTGNIVELSLAQVKVNANASTVQVVDERFTEHCGLVELLAEVPLNELMEQWNTWFADRQKEVSKYATTSGTGGNYIANINGITELLEGLKITVKFHEGRTGESFINLNGFGNTPIKKPGGGNPNIKANGVYSLVFDGLNFQLQGEGGEYGTATPNEVLEGYTIGTEQGLIEGILKLTGTALSNQVLAGRTFYNTNAKTKVTGTMPNRGTVSNTITTQGGSYTIPKGYHSGSGKVTASFANLLPENIMPGITIGGVTGRNMTVKMSGSYRDGGMYPPWTAPKGDTKTYDVDTDCLFLFVTMEGDHANSAETGPGFFDFTKISPGSSSTKSYSYGTYDGTGTLRVRAYHNTDGTKKVEVYKSEHGTNRLYVYWVQLKK